MRKITMTLVVAALTAASLVATEGASFAARRHAPKKGVTRTIGAKKGKKASNRFLESALDPSAFGVQLAQRRGCGHKGGKHRSGPRGNPVPVIG